MGHGEEDIALAATLIGGVGDTGLDARHAEGGDSAETSDVERVAEHGVDLLGDLVAGLVTAHVDEGDGVLGREAGLVKGDLDAGHEVIDAEGALEVLADHRCGREERRGQLLVHLLQVTNQRESQAERRAQGTQCIVKAFICRFVGVHEGRPLLHSSWAELLTSAPGHVGAHDGVISVVERAVAGAENPAKQNQCVDELSESLLSATDRAVGQRNPQSQGQRVTHRSPHKLMPVETPTAISIQGMRCLSETLAEARASCGRRGAEHGSTYNTNSESAPSRYRCKQSLSTLINGDEMLKYNGGDVQGLPATRHEATQPRTHPPTEAKRDRGTQARSMRSHIA